MVPMPAKIAVTVIILMNNPNIEVAVYETLWSPLCNLNQVLCERFKSKKIHLEVPHKQDTVL